MHWDALLIMIFVVQCNRDKLAMHCIAYDRHSCAMRNKLAMHWNASAYDTHSVAMYQDCIANDKHSCAMH